MAGEFLKRYFEEKQNVHIKPNNEADVLCPFPHDKGLEKRPSAHINVEKGIFHCKTCSAEGRFHNGGLSETSFIANIYETTYTQAIQMQKAFNKKQDEEPWDRAVGFLLDHQENRAYLEQRGITEEMILEYKLGSSGDGIIYPVFVNGILLDKRTYNPNPQENEAKIKSQTGAHPLLFPFDHWSRDERPTLLCAGENDTLLARKYGFNALTSTFGEGSFPDVFLGLFKNKTVYICYDCDEAGRKGSLKVAFKLKDVGANVKLVDLGLTGEKDDKDITDFFIKHHKTAHDLQHVIDEAIPYDGDMYQQAKNEYYPLVNLWEVHHGEYSGKRISSRVAMMGKYDMPMEVPTAIEWECTRPEAENSVCELCPKNRKSGWWVLEDQNLHEVLELVEVDKVTQEKAINRFIGLPPKCPGISKVRREKKHVQKVIFSPDSETESESSGFKMAEHYSYVLGLDLEDGNRYRAYMRRYPHPKTQAVVSVVDKVENSDAGINQFKVTEDVIQLLSQFQGRPSDVMDQLFEVGKQVIGNYVPRQIFEAVIMMYHSVLDLRLAGKPLRRGYLEGLIVGASRTGKTEAASRWMEFLKLGNMTAVKGATVPGLLGGADKLPSGGHRIRWGTIPRNNKGLLILDEMSGIPQNVISAMTDMRSSGVATIEKIVSGKAPARTRLLWTSNQRSQFDGTSRPIDLYVNGVDIIRELVGTNEDIARFDFIIIVPENDTFMNPLLNKGTGVKLENTAFRNLVYWAWTRSIDQVVFDLNVEQYMWQLSEELNDKYYTKGLNIFGAETFTKLARIAASCAAMCFSHDGTGENMVIRKEHADWARDFMVRCYDNEVFRFARFVENERKFSTTNEEINTITLTLLKKYPMIIKLLLEQEVCPIYNLKAAGGISDEEFKHITNQMYTNGLIQISPRGFTSTRRLRLSVNAVQSTKAVKVIDKEKPKSFFDQIQL